jgi:type I restriction enzyme S subunit
MKYQTYPAYKNSGVEWLGDVPEHWTVSKIKYIAPFQVGWTPPTKNDANFEGENLWANISDLREKIIFDTAKKISDAAAKAASMSITPEGSLLYSFKLSVGTVSFAGNDMYTNEAIASFLDCAKLPLSYLYYVLPKFVIENASTNIYGARILNQELINGAMILAPTFQEAQKIAQFLDHETAKIDTLIEKQQRLIELLKEKRQAVISHAVTKGLNPNAPMKESGVEWLGDVPEGWEVRTVAKSSNKITNGYVGQTKDILVDEGVPYIQATHIKRGKVNFDGAYFVRQNWSDAHSKSILSKGDVLIVQTGAGTGDIGLVTEKEEGFNCHALIIVEPVKTIISGDFLSMVFQSQYGYSKLYSIRTGGMHPHLNCGEVQFVKLPIPPRDEQNEIINYIERNVTTFDLLINKQLDAIKLMQERRTALISAAVTGKIDVREWENL